MFLYLYHCHLHLLEILRRPCLHEATLDDNADLVTTNFGNSREIFGRAISGQIWTDAFKQVILWNGWSEIVSVIVHLKDFFDNSHYTKN